jgi:hypothetical protein
MLGHALVKLGIIATQIADDTSAALFFDEVRVAPAARADAETYGRVSGTFPRPLPATTSRPARKLAPQGPVQGRSVPSARRRG